MYVDNWFIKILILHQLILFSGFFLLKKKQCGVEPVLRMLNSH